MIQAVYGPSYGRNSGGGNTALKYIRMRPYCPGIRPFVNQEVDKRPDTVTVRPYNGLYHSTWVDSPN